MTLSATAVCLLLLLLTALAVLIPALTRTHRKIVSLINEVRTQLSGVHAETLSQMSSTSASISGSNQIAQVTNQIAQETNQIARETNQIAREANQIAREANQIAQETKQTVRALQDRVTVLEQVLLDPNLCLLVTSPAGRASLVAVLEQVLLGPNGLRSHFDDANLPAHQQKLAVEHAVWKNDTLTTLLALQQQSLAGLVTRAHALQEARPETNGAGQPSPERSELLARRRSVVFYGHSYYHFYHLARALRARGWNAVSITLESPDSPHDRFYHGQDLSLFAADPQAFRERLRYFFEYARDKFEMVHFAGDGHLSFMPDNYDQVEPEDLIEWRARGKRIAYTVSGCSSGVAQSTVSRWSALDGRVVCDTCKWQNRPDVCADDRNLAWGRKIEQWCDIIFGDGVPALDSLASPKAVREPVTTCLDPLAWTPDLKIPQKFKVARKKGEILIYHSFGNFNSRTSTKRNLKGTPFVVEAVDQLQKEGLPVRLLFVTDATSIEVKYLQAQADIVVDQLHVGRYGATCREAMMLGRPVICYLNRHELDASHELQSLREIPVVSATPQTLSDELRALALNESSRIELGRKSRDYAVRWHSADGCAQRYEALYDSLVTRGQVDPSLALPASEAASAVSGAGR